MSIKSVRNDNIADNSFVISQQPTPPVITGYSISGQPDTALDVAGGQTVFINGAGFQRGATVSINGATVSVVTWVSTNRLSFTSTAASAGTYTIYVVNADGGTAVYVPGLIYSSLPSWTTTAGNIGSFYETRTISSTVAATGDVPITYSLDSGSIPTGATFNANGVITGTAPADSGSTTYSFTVRASDAQQQSSTRSFSLTINTDVVTWATPSNGASITLDGSAYSQSLTATSAAGYSVSYTANTLPAGLSLSSGNISGTPTTEGSTTTLLTATAATSGRSATDTITWTVSIGDANWTYSTTLISPTLSTLPFNADASSNNFSVAINGDTRPNNFNPYTPGYYSITLNGSTDYINAGTNSLFNLSQSGTWTIETWVYFTNNGVRSVFATTRNGSNTNGWYLQRLAANTIDFGYAGGTTLTTTATVLPNVWNHIAVTRDGTTYKIYINGVESASGTLTSNAASTDLIIGYGTGTGGPFYTTGSISNFRIVNGSLVYSANFTPPTAPLTAIANTAILTCQGNRFVDASTNNFAISITGTPRISGFNPFTPEATLVSRGSTYFDGTGDFLTTPTNSNLLSFAGNFTIEFWAYHTSSGSTNICSINPISATGTGIAIYITTTAVYFQSSYAASNAIAATGLADVANIWVHYAFVRLGSTVTAYRNGVSIGTATLSTNYSTSTSALRIGYDASNSPAGYFTGHMSDIRVVNGTAVYTANFTPPTAPLTAITNTSLLTCQTNQPANNNAFLDNSTNNSLVTRSGNTTQGTFSPYGESWSNYFDGTGDYLTVPNTNSIFSFGTGNFTIEAWVYLNTMPSGNGYPASYWIVGGGPSNADIGFDVAIGSTNLQVGLSNFTSLNINFAHGLAVGRWYHIAVVRNSNTLSAYRDGTLLTSSSVTGVTADSCTSGLAISAAEPVGATSGNFNGYISNLRVVKGTAVYTSNFTPSTSSLQPIAGTSLLICKDPNFVDESPNNLTVTKTGDVSVQKFSPFNGVTLPTPFYSAFFDGSGDYLTAPNTISNFGTGDFTIECWFFKAGTSTILTTNQDGGSDNNYWTLDAANSQATFQVRDGAGQAYAYGPAITNNTWTHIAVTRSSGTVRVFVNGVSGTPVSITKSVTSRLTVVGAFLYTGFEAYFTGYISNLRIVKGTAVYTSNFTTPTAPLAAISNTVLLTGQSNRFIDNSANNVTITANGNVRPAAFSPFTLTYSTKQSYSPAVIGGSMYFDGTGDFLTVPLSTAFGFGTGDFTVECWVYPTVNARQDWIDITNGTQRALLYYSGSAIVFYSVPPNAAAITGPAMILNAWTHLAVSKQSGNTRLFVNGVQVGSTYTSNQNYGASASVTIGKDSAGTTHATGYISDVRIVKGQSLYASNFVPQNAPLQAIGNTTLLLNGTSAGIIDNTGIAVYETVGDAKEVTNIFKYGNTSMYFDGTGDGLLALSSPTLSMGSGDFTIEFWYNPTSTAGTNPNIMCNNNGSSPSFLSGQWSFHAPHSVHANKYSFWVASFATNTALLVSTSNIATNTWTHISVTRSGSSWRLFINGTVEATATHTGILDSGSNPLYIGHQPNVESGRFITGYMSDLRITKGAARYTSNFTAPTSAFSTK